MAEWSTRRRLPQLIWLTLVWVMLWGAFDPGSLVFGLIVALLVTVLFPAPPITTHLVLRPLPLVMLIGYVSCDLLISTLRVSWQALRYGSGAKAGIVAVTLRTDSDHLTALIANAVSLAPGKFVLHIDRVNRLCYVYVLGMREQDIATVRHDVLALEQRVVRAVGSAAERHLVRSDGS